MMVENAQCLLMLLVLFLTLPVLALIMRREFAHLNQVMVVINARLTLDGHAQDRLRYALHYIVEIIHSIQVRLIMKIVILL